MVNGNEKWKIEIHSKYASIEGIAIDIQKCRQPT